MKTQFWKTFGAWAVGASALLGGVQSAQASLITGSYDPNFGPAFSSLRWRGTATFDVPDACMTLPGYHLNPAVCSGNTQQILGATVQFFSVTDTFYTTPLDTLTWGSSSVTGMTFTPTSISGVDAGLNGLQNSVLGIAGGGNYSFSLTFDNSLGATLHAFWVGSGPEPIRYTTTEPEVVNHYCGIYDGVQLGCTSNPAEMTFSNVPEPGTLALMAGALLAGGLVRRRRI